MLEKRRRRKGIEKNQIFVDASIGVFTSQEHRDRYYFIKWIRKGELITWQERRHFNLETNYEVSRRIDKAEKVRKLRKKAWKSKRITGPLFVIIRHVVFQVRRILESVHMHTRQINVQLFRGKSHRLRMSGINYKDITDWSKDLTIYFPVVEKAKFYFVPRPASLSGLVKNQGNMEVEIKPLKMLPKLIFNPNGQVLVDRLGQQPLDLKWLLG
jgi:hypothetical protein